MVGLTETTEAIDAVFELLHAARDAAADGVSVADLTDGMAEGPVKAAVVKAAEGADKIPGEVDDLSWTEGVELGQHVLGKVRELAS